MILKLLHAVASRSSVYDFIQVVAGADQVYSRVAKNVSQQAPGARVLDLGGGTGTISGYLPGGYKYLCLDLEFEKLSGFLRKKPGSMAVQGDATRLPLPDSSFDSVVCTLVSHHIPIEVLAHAFAECSRVLRPQGTFVFLDALRRPDRWLSRFMWSIDRGAYPHDLEELTGLVSKRFSIGHTERFTMYHEYALFVLKKRD